MKNEYKSVIILVFLAMFVFVFSYYALWLGDDITYAYSFEDGSRISHFNQVLPSQLAHYITENGRTPAHFLCQLFIPFFGKLVFSLSNALVYVVLLLLMARFCQIRLYDWKKMALIAMLIVLGFRTKFTPTCQIGYPWMFAIIIAFLLVFKRFGDDTHNRWSGWHLVWALPLSLIAGWSQEALVIGVGASLAVYVLLHIHTIRISQWIVLFTFGIGAALLCFSPATIGRTGDSFAASNLITPRLFSLVKLVYYLRITYLMLAMGLFLIFVKKIPVKKLILCAGNYWIIWAVLMVFNLIISVYGNRQLFGIEFAAMIIIVKWLQSYFPPEGQKSNWGRSACMGILAVCCLFVSLENIKFLKHHWAVYNTIDAAYNDSEDGVVYYDFSASDVTFKDTFPSDVFSWYALETMNRAYGDSKRLKVVPTICKQLGNTIVGNTWERIAQGTIAVVIEKSILPNGAVIKRSILGKPISDSEIDLNKPFFEKNGQSVYLVYEKMPFVKHDEILFYE